MGITRRHFNELINLGVDTVTMGNHTWGKKDIFEFIDDPKLIRPANYPARSSRERLWNIYMQR